MSWKTAGTKDIQPTVWMAKLLGGWILSKAVSRAKGELVSPPRPPLETSLQHPCKKPQCQQPSAQEQPHSISLQPCNEPGSTGRAPQDQTSRSRPRTHEGLYNNHPPSVESQQAAASSIQVVTANEDPGQRDMLGAAQSTGSPSVPSDRQRQGRGEAQGKE